MPRRPDTKLAVDRELSEAEKCYLAALLDACVNVHVDQRGVALSLQKRNKALLDKLAEVYGGKVVRASTASYRWRLTRRVDAHRALSNACQYSVTEGESLKAVIEYLELPVTAGPVARARACNSARSALGQERLPVPSFG